MKTTVFNLLDPYSFSSSFDLIFKKIYILHVPYYIGTYILLILPSISDLLGIKKYYKKLFLANSLQKIGVKVKKYKLR